MSTTQNAVKTQAPNTMAELQAQMAALLKAQAEQAAEQERLKAELAAAQEKLSKAKAVSPWIDSKAFLAEAQELTAQSLTGVKGKARVFSTGSYGWNMNGKAKVTVNGKECTVQVSVNAIVIGSKPAATTGSTKAQF